MPHYRRAWHLASLLGRRPEREVDEELEVDDSALYQALQRLETRGLLTAEWGITENNRRARYYKIRPSGRSYLRAEGANLARYAQALTEILSLPST